MNGYDSDSGVMFESVSFQGELLNITFTEAHERGDGVAIVRTLVMDSRKVEREYGEFMDALQTLVDAGQRTLRNPPETRPGR